MAVTSGGAQYGEDEILYKFFGNKASGIVVDVGAANGIDNSNSFMLLQRHGWSGILIEPEQVQFEEMEMFYKDRANVKCVNIAAGQTPGPMPFYPCEQVSTFKEDWRDRCIEGHKVRYEDTVMVMVEQLSTILDGFDVPHDIDFLSIDCEGMDMEVWYSLGSKYRPRLVCLEGKGHQMPGYKELCTTRGNTFHARV